MKYLAVEWPYIVLAIPILWLTISLIFSIGSLCYTWTKIKMDELKELIK